jgi:hypothetical protein
LNIPTAAASSLDAWIEHQYHHSAQQMLHGISATDIIKERPGFGQTVQAHVGSVVASPVLASYDPDPDYFFHWYRDSAIVMDAMRRSSSSNSSCGSAWIWMHWTAARWWRIRSGAHGCVRTS